jgi:3-keto-L-gulonate-6-phosphate decarboxylase
MLLHGRTAATITISAAAEVASVVLAAAVAVDLEDSVVVDLVEAEQAEAGKLPTHGNRHNIRITITRFKIQQ